MKKVKITILKTMLNEDLIKEYGISGLKACPMMKVGDMFSDYTKPEDFYDEAWKAIYQYVFTISIGHYKNAIGNLERNPWRTKRPKVQ